MLVVRLMADRYDLPKAERIVHEDQTISPIEYWFSLILLRLNFGGIFYLIVRSITGIGKEATLDDGTLQSRIH